MISVGIKFRSRSSGSTSSGSVSVSGGSSSSTSVAYATEAGSASTADYATKAGKATTANYASSAGSLTDDAVDVLTETLGESFLQKDGDTATGLITFGAGLAVGDGTYGVDEEGNATFLSVNAGEAAMDSATIGTGNVTGDLSVSGSTNTTGITNMGDISNTGDITNTGNIVNSGNVDVTGELSVTGDTTLADLISQNITNSGDLTTKNLTVTGTAHFFELVIDKIEAAGGAVMFTPADGFTIRKVVEVDDGWRLYWLAEDSDGTSTTSMWQTGDQALCLNFNQAAAGSTTEVSNNYWWRLVTAASTDDGESAEAIELTIGDEEATYTCHWIEVSASDYDGDGTPTVGDDVAMCGNRTDESRQTAIYISAYTSLDAGLTAPFWAQYRGIDDYDLSSHRYTYFDASGARFVGNFAITSTTDEGDTTTDIADYIDDAVSNSSQAYAPYIDDETGTWWVWKDGAWVDSGVSASVDLDALPRKMKIELALGGFMYVDETETVTLSVWDVCELTDYTENYTFSVERDSGDDSSDAVWNNSFAANYSGGSSFTLTFSDLNFTSGSRTTKFWVTATENESSDTIEEVIEY